MIIKQTSLISFPAATIIEIFVSVLAFTVIEFGTVGQACDENARCWSLAIVNQTQLVSGTTWSSGMRCSSVTSPRMSFWFCPNIDVGFAVNIRSHV